MNVLSRIYDKRINSMNLYVEMTFGEYLSFADKIIDNNLFQRKRVRTSKTVYSLLKNDLIAGCVMPPIVLAITENETIKSDDDNTTILEFIKNNPQKVLILDGLQRTYTLIDAEKEVDGEKRQEFLNYILRLELYIEINKFGVLYRMLTLNTGQTPMSARHQLEILYTDLLDTEIKGVRLIPEVKGAANSANNEFLFKNVIEGFNSYLSRDELPMDRQDILENIKMLEHMSAENTQVDLFKEFLESYVLYFNTVRDITADKVLDEEQFTEYEIVGTPFGKSASKIFSTSQAMTGFGAAIGIMKDKNIISDIAELNQIIEQIKAQNKGMEWLLILLKYLDTIRSTSKKIGNAQRMFFKYFYRELFNEESDSYLDLEEAVKNGYRKYNSQVN